MNTDTQIKKLMDQLAAELAKEKRHQNRNLLKSLNTKIDQALGIDLSENREDASGLVGDYGQEEP